MSASFNQVIRIKSQYNNNNQNNNILDKLDKMRLLPKTHITFLTFAHSIFLIDLFVHKNNNNSKTRTVTAIYVSLGGVVTNKI